MKEIKQGEAVIELQDFILRNIRGTYSIVDRGEDEIKIISREEYQAKKKETTAMLFL